MYNTIIRCSRLNSLIGYFASLLGCPDLSCSTFGRLIYFFVSILLSFTNNNLVYLHPFVNVRHQSTAIFKPIEFCRTRQLSDNAANISAGRMTSFLHLDLPSHVSVISVIVRYNWIIYWSES